MDKGQFAILRFAKYKGPEISNIEAHNERTKEKYASNPDVDVNRSNTFWALVLPNHLRAYLKNVQHAQSRSFTCVRMAFRAILY